MQTDTEARIEKKLDEILRRLDLVEGHLSLINLQGDMTMTVLDDLAVQVQANADAEESAITLIKGLADELAANANDGTRIAALAAQLKTQAAALGAAVVANTPAPPPAPPAQPPSDAST